MKWQLMTRWGLSFISVDSYLTTVICLLHIPQQKDYHKMSTKDLAGFFQICCIMDHLQPVLKLWKHKTAEDYEDKKAH